MINLSIPTDYGSVQIVSLGKRELTENTEGDWNLYCKKTFQEFYKDDSIKIFSLDQVHSDLILKTDHILSDSKGDCFYSDKFDQSLVIRTADCVPILIWSFDFPFVGAIHSGWKGTKLGITEKFIKEIINSTIDNLDQNGKIVNPRFGFYIGAHILGDDYEVSEDVAVYFEGNNFVKPKRIKGKFNLNLSGYIQYKIRELIPNAVIMQINQSTLASPDWFSFRSGESGRNLHSIRMIDHKSDQ